MPLYPVTAGQRLTATALNRAWDVNRTVYQVVDQTVNNTVALVSSTGLTLTVEANAVYVLIPNLIYISPTAADFRVNFSYPSGASFRWTLWDLPLAETVSNGSLDRVTVDDFGAFAGGGIGAGMMSMRPVGRLTTSTTAGNFTVQFAQWVATVGNTTLKAGSSMQSIRIA